MLENHYRIKDVVGSGGFGITYLAHDQALDIDVVVKEYYPRSLARRAEDGSLAVETGSSPAPSDRLSDGTFSVTASTGILGIPERGEAKVFEWGLRRFLDEATTLARLSHPNIVRIYRYFRANQTAYIAMELADGRSLQARLSDGSWRPTQAVVDGIVEPVLSALEALHAQGMIHRDLAPQNIVIRKDGSPVLLDFGAARRSGEERGEYAVVTAHFSPPELYLQDGKIGPWSDIYSLAATIYLMVCGRSPPEATGRLVANTYESLVSAAGSGNFRREFLRGVDWALSLQPGARPQSVSEWRGDLYPWQNLTGRRAATRSRGRKIFISYRRSDSRAEARQVYQQLIGHFDEDEIFFDVDSVPMGVDFRDHIRGSIASSAVVLAVIGPAWSRSFQSSTWKFWQRPREDFVRIELELAIEHGIPVLPVLVDGAAMPRASALPSSLSPVSYANAATLSGAGAAGGMQRLIERIRQFRD